MLNEMIEESERVDKFQRSNESLTRQSIQETRRGSDMGRRESVMPDQPPRAAATMAASDDPQYGSCGSPPAVRNRDVPVEPEHGYVVPRPGDYSYGPSWPPSDQPTLDPTGWSYGDVPVEPEHGCVVPRSGDYSYGQSWPPFDQPVLDPTGRSYGDQYFTNTSAPSPSYTSYDYGSAAIPSPFNVAQSRYAPGGPYPEPEQPSPAPYNRGYGDDRNPALGYTGMLTNPSTYPSTPPNARRPQTTSGDTDELICDGIHREVLQREICKYLGPEASSRPSLYNI